MNDDYVSFEQLDGTFKEFYCPLKNGVRYDNHSPMLIEPDKPKFFLINIKF